MLHLEMLYCRQVANTHLIIYEGSVMTGKPIALTKTKGKRTRFPDFLPREDMQNWLYLYRRSFPAALANHLGSPETTIVASEVPVSLGLDHWPEYRIPDLLVSRNASLELCIKQNGYLIDSQGKPPDLVLEVASRTTGVNDYTVKRSDYERYGVTEYWRFDPSGGDYHDAALAGDRLVDGRYAPIPVEWLDDNRYRGYSNELGLYLCWEYGELRWYDPIACEYLQTYEEEVTRGNQEALRAEQEAARADRAEAELRRMREQLNDR